MKLREFTMYEPVRKIGISSRSITGTMPNGNRYESSLERDLMILMDFDPSVHLYTPQPLVIKYQSSDGKNHRYTPDGLIEYRSRDKSKKANVILVEVKYRSDFVNKFNEVLPKFRAANLYAKNMGWEFKIFTDDRIRGPFLENAKFLNAYKSYFHEDFDLLITEKLEKLRVSTPKELVCSIFKDKWNQAKMIPVLWGMIARREVGCDLTKTLTMKTTIWSL
ncbi:heteromeric transposase endonuclease subunit TnsA [Acinetobacter suaedae]|uniref:Heteromeric transposase endonuclease subunit TnsA n=2 Tax=Acinetobacter suaedae TaxID=2609668 RepID=A0A5P1UXH8_9GAMM|nr:heteromeric transposase endonuclease subunit TnsA [Acinetobacter sp. C16S1]